jgi:hypothetical protein
MKSIRGLALAAAFFAMLAAGVPATAKDAHSIAITPASPKAAIIIKAELLPVPPGHKTSYLVGLQSYDPARQAMTNGPFGGSATFAAQPKAFVDGYLVIEVDPGTYAFRDVSREDYWAVCFNGGSLSFTVKPGEIVYLGEMDVRLHVAELERLAVMSHRTSTRNGQAVHFFDTVTPPAMAPIDEADLAAAAAMVRTRMPASTVAPRAAVFSKAKFGTGHDLFGLSRICGGYYQGRAK